MAITTASEYRTNWATGVPSSDDTRTTAIISAVSRLAERICGRTLTASGATSFESGTYTETFSGEGHESIQLSNTPITSITSVTQTAGDGSTLYTYASTEYKVSLTSGEIQLSPVSRGRFNVDDFGIAEGDPITSVTGTSPVFPQQFRNITVVYVGGYSTIPDDLKMAIWRLVDLFRAQAGKDALVQAESIGERSVTYANTNQNGTALEAQARAILIECGIARYDP